ncbi:MAG: trehalose-phosphatase [Bdellovibrionales bacterium]|nr:trehalose-phosphatase [Bdellovibrionales bacterium]
MKTSADVRLRKILRVLLAKPGPRLLAFDFDGTLVGFRDDPRAVELSRTQAELLRKLASRFPVAILSGRSRADLRKKFSGIPVRYLVGNHGLENGGAVGEKWKRDARTWARAFRKELARRPEWRGVYLEDKRHSVSLHFRKVRDSRRVEAELRKWAKSLRPAPRVVPGFNVLNVVPARGDDKGRALRRLLKEQGYRSAFFAGDDVTDEDVFRLRNPRILTVRIGRPSVPTAARYRLGRRGELTRFLRLLLRESTLDPP